MSKNQFTDEVKKEIDNIVASLKHHNFYTILGIGTDASDENIKRAYFSLSKSFHPDAYYGENLREYKVHLEKVFRSITRAYDVLSKPAKREKYNNYLKRKNDLRGLESSAARDMSEVRERVRQRTGMMPAISMTGAQEMKPEEVEPQAAPAARSVPSVPTAEEKKFDRSILEKTAGRHAGWRKRRLKSLLNIQDVRVQQQKVSEEVGGKIRDLLKKAEEAEKEKNYLGAINVLKVAITLDPKNNDLQERFNNILVQFSPVLGQKYYSIGLNEEEFGDVASAVESFRRAVEYVPDNAEYIYKLSKSVFESGGDLHQAYNFAKGAISLSSSESLYYLLFGKICLKAGLTKSAASALNTCLKLDSKNLEARALLKQM